MNIGKLLGIVSPGLSALGAFGGGAQGVGQGALGAMSPLMALLLHHNKQGADPAAAPDAGTGPNPSFSPDPIMASVSPPAAPAQQAPQPGGMDPKRQRIAQMLLSLGSSMNGGFGQPRY